MTFFKKPRLLTATAPALLFAATAAFAPTQAVATSDIPNQPAIDCTSWSANRIDCFVMGTNSAMFHRWWNSASWGGWESQGGLLTSLPNCTSWGPNRIDCFVRGTNNAMFHRWWDGVSWGGWEGLGGIILD